MPRPLLTVCSALPVTLSSLQTTCNTLSQPASAATDRHRLTLTANNNGEAITLLNSAGEGEVMLSDMMVR